MDKRQLMKAELLKKFLHTIDLNLIKKKDHSVELTKDIPKWNIDHQELNNQLILEFLIQEEITTFNLI